MIHHFYHLYADGKWRTPWYEHLSSMMELGEEHINKTVCIVGSNENCMQARNCIPLSWNIEMYYDGYEQRTLDLIFGSGITDDDMVLYAHSKGSANVSQINDDWRRCMTRHLIDNWRNCLAEMAVGADTVGVHWLTPEEHPKTVTIPYYGGNFWWARGSHIRKLPPPSHETRYHAEAWLGTVRPEHPVDLQPGWPGAGCATH